MKTDQYGQMIFSEPDIFNFIMQGRILSDLKGMLVDSEVNVETAVKYLDQAPELLHYVSDTISVEEFDSKQQTSWHMPDEYKQLDIAEYVLHLCSTPEQLQRCGEELLLFQERNLFNLLRYLKYLVDTMRSNNIIWGVGRGSSTASYILFKLGIHRIDSLFYQLDIAEFLR